jgi:WD40 repeat protein
MTAKFPIQKYCFKALIRILCRCSSGLGDEVATFKATGPVTAMAFSPDGDHLAVADANRKVHLLKAKQSFEKAHTREWGFHTAKVRTRMVMGLDLFCIF